MFINEVAIEVASGPFNVKEAFGDDAVLIHSWGQPVVTNEWGVTLHSLQHGAFYYLLSTAIHNKLTPPFTWYIPIYFASLHFYSIYTPSLRRIQTHI